MRDIKEILASDKFREDKIGLNVPYLVTVGYLNLPGVKKTLQCIVGIEPDADGRMWEHVSVRFCGKNMEVTPSWEVMCKVKDFFWQAEEEVHQIHPRESEYLHGVGKMNNILHLYRPVDGWKENPNRGEH